MLYFFAAYIMSIGDALLTLGRWHLPNSMLYPGMIRRSLCSDSWHKSQWCGNEVTLLSTTSILISFVKRPEIAMTV